MAVDKFKFVSPGVFIEEIDESGVTALPERMGPLVIGRFKKGPSNRPVTVNSYKEFIQTFGTPSAGRPQSEVWRSGDMTAPTYAAYAVQAWLRNNAPCTVFRVLGEHPSNVDTSVATAQAGWKTDNVPGKVLGDAGGAYGLFVMPNPDHHGGSVVFGGSTGDESVPVTGTLAAVWYVQDGGVMITGSDRSGSARQGLGVAIKSSNQEFTAKIVKDASTTVLKKATFNFDRDSDKYIRKVFNTDPTKTNSDLVAAADLEYYWLGESFDTAVRNDLKVSGSSLTSTGEFLGVILSLDGTAGGASFDWHDRRRSAKASETGWFFSNDTRGDDYSGFDVETHTQNLFKFIALDSGESANRDIKISLTNIKAPTDKFNEFGTFSVLVRRATDSDHKPEIVERFNNVNLDPGSPNYIAKVIGDKHYSFDTTSKILREHGNYANRSKHVRVKMDDAVDRSNAGMGKHPFGVYGPAVPKTFCLESGSTVANLFDNNDSEADIKPYVCSTGSAPDSLLVNEDNVSHGTGLLIFQGNYTNATSSLHPAQLSASIEFPTTRLRVSSSEGDMVKGTHAYFGYNSCLENTRRFDPTNLDLLRGAPANINPGDAISDTTQLQYSWIFTLDDVKKSKDNENHAVWVSGSRALNESYTALTGTSGVLTAGYNKFTSPMFGGFDGFDVTERDPFRNEFLSSNEAERTNYAYYSLKKAVDMVADPEFIEYDVVTMPGIKRTKLTKALVNNCEDRGDALAIVDLPGDYVPPHENNSEETDNLPNVTTTVDNLKENEFNSSYGCAFYPYVQIRDTLNDAILYVPPSVVALGTFSSSQKKSAVWFAPAGFTRGGLSEGSSGLPVINVRQRLNSEERDKLYDANINPIASFPSEGIVIFGQKTLQVTPSALDRINVRRLLIHTKKEISRIASRILFEQNVQATWDKFTGQVVPFLESIKAGLGLVDFRVVLDSDTTTPDLIDRNILYAKIYLKPAKAIEFIALDFIITKSGASFDD